MRIIEKTWVDLLAGHETIRSLEVRLKSDWKRAIQVTVKRSDRAAEIRQIRKRKITGISLLVFVFICILFCAGYYYLPETRLQLFVYFCMLGAPAVILWLVYLFNFGGVTGSRHETSPSLEIEDSWWKHLMPKRYEIRREGDRGEVDFLRSLSFLDNNHIAVWGLLTSAKRRSDTDVLLLGPSGIWIFEVKYWNGTISRKNGIWSAKNQYGITKTYDKSPDAQWLDQKEEVWKTIRMQLRDRDWPAELIKGGIVFAHRNSRLGAIEQAGASYGQPGFWHKQLKETAPLEDFDLKDRLQVLDALILYANRHEREAFQTASADDTANAIYQNAETALRNYVSEKMK